MIVELLPYSTPSLDRVARRLGTSSRSLGRRLAEDGTSFKQLVNEFRSLAYYWIAGPCRATAAWR